MSEARLSVRKARNSIWPGPECIAADTDTPTERRARAIGKGRAKAAMRMAAFRRWQREEGE